MPCLGIAECMGGTEPRLDSRKTIANSCVQCAALERLRPRVLAHVALALAPTWACVPDRGAFGPSRFDGQWVLESEGGPMAMEVRHAGTPQMGGSIVGAVGGRTQPFLESSIVDGRLAFRVARQFESGTTVGSGTVAWFEGDRLVGETTRDDRDLRRAWTGRRPDAVTDVDSGSWFEQEPVVLFNGSALSEWSTSADGGLEGWLVEDGILRNVGNADELVSNRRFWNFRLQAEYRVSEGGNSGIGLRGRYEVQIHDDFGTEPSIHGNGAIYSRIKPSTLASRVHTEWQTLDVRLVGRIVTVTLNGITIIDRQVIEGITAMARDADESAPGAILLQGDHGPIEFRRIVVIPLALH